MAENCCFAVTELSAYSSPAKLAELAKHLGEQYGEDALLRYGGDGDKVELWTYPRTVNDSQPVSVEVDQKVE